MAKSDKKADKKATKSKSAKPAPSPAKAVPKEVLPKAKKLKSNGKAPVKPVIDDSSDDSSEDEQPKKTVVSSDSDESPEEKKPAKTPASKKGKGKVESSDSSDASSSDGSSSDEDSDKDVKMRDVQPVKGKKAADTTKCMKPAVSQAKAKLPASSKEILANAKVPKTNGKAPESSDESSESSSGEEEPKKTVSVPDSDESSEDETPARVPAGKASKAEVESDSSDSSSSNESSSDGDDVKVEDAQPAKGTKRKAEAEPAAPPKKVKMANGDAAPSDSAEETKSVFVGRLSWNVDNDWLAQEFASCGEVVSAHIQTDRATGKSRGFGYVHFTTADAVEKALEMNGKEIDGRPVNIDKSTPPDKNAVRENRAKSFGDTQSPASNVLFVGNLSFAVNEDQLWELFGEHGDVKSVRVPTDRDSGRPKGFAYVEFSALDAAKTAHEQLQGYELDGRNLRLDFSQPRDSAGGGGGRGRGGFGDRGRSGFGDRGRGRGGFGGGDRGRGGFGGDRGGRGRGRGGDRGGRGGGRGRGGPRTGAVAPFEGSKITFD